MAIDGFERFDLIEPLYVIEDKAMRINGRRGPYDLYI